MRITVETIDDDGIMLTSDEDPIGMNFYVDRPMEERKKMMYGLAVFLGYDPAEILILPEPIEED